MKNMFEIMGRDYAEDLGVDARIILERILIETDWEGVDWIHLAQDKDYWRALVNTVTNLWVP
jgi:hypothetical protein